MAVVIFDPFKALCCAALIDPIVAVVTCDWSGEALLETMEEVVETYTEDFTSAVDDEMNEEFHEGVRAAAVAAVNNSVFAFGSFGAERWMQKTRTKRGAKEKTQTMRSEQEVVKRRLELQKVKSDKLYSSKVAEKRAKVGMDKGEYYERAWRQSEEFGALSEQEIKERTDRMKTQMQIQAQEHQAELIHKRKEQTGRYRARLATNQEKSARQQAERAAKMRQEDLEAHRIKALEQADIDKFNEALETMQRLKKVPRPATSGLDSVVAASRANAFGKTRSQINALRKKQILGSYGSSPRPKGNAE